MTSKWLLFRIAVSRGIFCVTPVQKTLCIRFMLLPEQTTELAPVHAVDPHSLFWFLEWDENVDSQLSAYISSTYPEDSPNTVVACAKLGFYKTFRLLRITRSGDKPQQGYALYRSEERGIEIRPLDGSTRPIYEVNRIPDELKLSDDPGDSKRALDDYLRFFSSTVHREDGPLLNLDPLIYGSVVNWKDNEDELKKLQSQLESETGLTTVTPQAQERLTNPFPQSRLKPRVAWIAYSSGIFRVWFAIDDSPGSLGRVQILDDELLLAGLSTALPKFSDGNLFVPNRFPREPSSTEPKEDHSFNPSQSVHYYGARTQSDSERAEVAALVVRWTATDTTPDKDSEGKVIFRGGVGIGTELAGLTELLIRGHHFTRPVRIENWTDPRPLIFDACRFEGGLSARGATIDRGISFINCAFRPLKECAGCEDIALDFSNARTNGDLILFSCRIEGRLFASGLRTRSSVRLQGCTIAPEKWGVEGQIRAGKVLDEAVESHLDSCFRPSPGDKGNGNSLIVFDNTTIRGLFEITSAGKEMVPPGDSEDPPGDKTASIVAGNLNCEGMEVDGNVRLSDLIVFGKVTFDSTQVTGDLTLRQTRVRGSGNRNDTRLTFNRARISGDLALESVEVKGQTSLYGSTVGGICLLNGLHCSGDLDLAFSSSNYLVAFRTQSNETKLDGRDSLRVEGNLWLSGAKIGIVELRGAVIGRNLTAWTGEFGILTLGLDIAPSGDAGEFLWPRPCEIGGALSLKSIRVRETLNMGGIQVAEVSFSPAKEKSSRLVVEQPRVTKHSLEVLNSRIAGTLVLFSGDNLLSFLERRWGPFIDSSRWQRPKIKTIPGWKKPLPAILPKPNAFPTEIDGDIIVRACQIGGDLDLRNVQLDPGGIFLDNTSVGLNLKVGLEGQCSSMTKVSDLATCCLCFDGEKLSCQGDVDLQGIRVEEKSGSGPKRRSVQAASGNIGTGDVSLRAARVAGNLLLASTKGPVTPNIGRLDLTSIRCEKLVFGNKNFYPNDTSKGRAQAVLARGHFGQVEILDWHKRPINLQQTTVDHWSFGREGQEGLEGKALKDFAEDCVRILQEMKPEDRSIWLSVESDLRNKTYEWQADRVYLAMVRNSMRRRREQWRLLGPLVFLWHFAVCLAQTCFLWSKAFFIVPLAFTVMTLAGLSFLFKEPANVRATVGYLHALPAATRMVMEDPNEIHPHELHEKWTKWDAIALALRYHVPLFESRTHDRWEASGSNAKICDFYLRARMETVALIIEVVYWIALPILLLGFAAWAFRKRETE